MLREMDEQEACKIISILLIADDSCRACTHILIDSFIDKFPGFKELAIQRWEEKFQKIFEDFD